MSTGILGITTKDMIATKIAKTITIYGFLKDELIIIYDVNIIRINGCKHPIAQKQD